MTNNKTTGTEVLLILVGALVLVYGCSALNWWIARHADWWTYSLALTGWIFFWSFVKEIWKELRK